MAKETFKTSIGEGEVWSDNELVRVVVRDPYGISAFRFQADQVELFIEALRKVAAVPLDENGWR